MKEKIRKERKIRKKCQMKRKMWKKKKRKKRKNQGEIGKVSEKNIEKRKEKHKNVEIFLKWQKIIRKKSF